MGSQDAVADAVEPVDPETDDWAAPPFEDLRGPSAKGVGVRDLRFELDGTPAVGEAVRLVVRATSSETVTLCVRGVERGVVWRGAVPTGRTVLSRDERAVRYRFATPGSYRFSLAVGDDPSCASPAHVVEVQL